MRWAFVLCAVAGGCGRLGFGEITDAGRDATSTPPDACASWGPFSAPARLPGPIQTPNDEWFPTPASNDLEVYFYAGVGGSFEIVRATRSTLADQFSASTVVTGINTINDEKMPSLSEDGLVIVFTRNTTSYELFEATRPDRAQPFGPPVQLALLGTQFNEISPWLSPDGLRMLYVGQSVIRETTRSSRAAAWSTPVPHTELQLGGFQESPTTTADGLDLWFANGAADFDIYTAHRATLASPFETPTRVAPLNSMRDDVGTRLSLDGATMYFNYDTLYGGGGNADAWIATRACK